MGCCSSQSQSQSLNNIQNSISFIRKSQNRELLYYCSIKSKTTIINIIQSVKFDGCIININLQCGNGWTPLLHVCQSTHGIKNENDTQKIIRFLLSYGADINLSNHMKWTPLIFSVKNNDEKSVKLLIENGAEINCQNTMGYTPIIYAAMNNNHILLNLLLSNSLHLVSFIERCNDKTIWDYVDKNSKCEKILYNYSDKCRKIITECENKFLCTGVLFIICDYLGYKY